MQYVGISTYQFILCYASAVHKHTHTRILKPLEDSEPTGPKVDIADSVVNVVRPLSPIGSPQDQCSGKDRTGSKLGVVKRCFSQSVRGLRNGGALNARLAD